VRGHRGFRAKREDGRAEWKVVYDHVTALPYGAMVSYGKIAGLLGTDDRLRAYRAVKECNRQLLRALVPRYLATVRGQGYQVMTPEEYAPAAIALKDAATRRMSTAVELMKAAPLDDMTPAARAWAEAVSLHVADHELRLMGMEARQQFAEARLAELERRAGVSRPATVPGQVEAG